MEVTDFAYKIGDTVMSSSFNGVKYILDEDPLDNNFSVIWYSQIVTVGNQPIKMPLTVNASEVFRITLRTGKKILTEKVFWPQS